MKLRNLTLVAFAFVAIFASVYAADGFRYLTAEQVTVTAGMVGDGTLSVSGAASITGNITNLLAVETYNTTTTAKTVTAADCKIHKTFIVGESGDDPVTFNLPTAVAGMEITFTDNDSTAAADLTINPADAASINGGTAGVSLNCTSDAVAQSITLRAISATAWVNVSAIGTWAAGS